MKKIRFKKLNIKWGNFFNYVTLIVLSSIILLNILIALPLTERLTDIVAFDLNVADDYWSKEYILDLETEDQKEINQTRNILFKRLNNYGVEEVSIYQEDGNLRVVVNTTLAQMYVEELIRNPYQFKIVTRKEDVNFEDEEDPYAQYMGDNYNETEFDYSTFRNIYITMLPNTSGDDSYFGLAKPWITKAKAFTDFLNNNYGKYIGVDIDGFVTPMYISESNIFAIPLSADETSIDVIDLLYNTGHIPTNYSISEQTDLEGRSLNISYIEISIAILVILVAIYAYFYFTNIYTKSSTINSFITSILGISTLLTFFKLTYVPVNPYLLILNAVFMLVLIRVLVNNKESRYLITASVFIIALIFRLLGIGYIQMLAKDLLTFSLLSLMVVWFSEYYINNISGYFKK